MMGWPTNGGAGRESGGQLGAGADRTRAAADGVFGLILAGRQRQASDLHIEPELGAALRVYTEIERVSGSALSAGEISAFVDATIDERARTRLERLGVADGVYADERVGALRIHVTQGKRGLRLAIRFLARAIPELESLRLPTVVERLSRLRAGLIVITGPTGSGKSTTIASLLDRLNATSAKNIVTFEDPVEYTHSWSRSIVTQYEVGRDVASYSEGIRGAMRADPDVLFIGELRGADTASACLQAAETGHAVFAALHTPSDTAHAVNRIVGLFPAHEQQSARARLADALRALIGLRLIPRIDGDGLRLAAEIAIGTEAVRRLIRDGATHQLRATIATGVRDGMQTLEAHLSELVATGEISLEAARAASLYPHEVRERAGNALLRDALMGLRR